MKTKLLSKLCYKKFNSQVKLSQGEKVIKTIDLNKAAVNWSLARLFITPQNEVIVNGLNQSNQDIQSEEKPVVKSIKDLGIVKFNNYLRKIGIIISSQSNIFVQTGKVGNTNTRIISGEKDSISSLSSIFNDKLNYDVDSSYTDVVVMTQGELKVKPFIIFDSEKKIIVTNSLNSKELKLKIEEFSPKV